MFHLDAVDRAMIILDPLRYCEKKTVDGACYFFAGEVIMGMSFCERHAAEITDSAQGDDVEFRKEK